MASRRVPYVILLAALLAPRIVRAEPSDEDKGTARALLLEGNDWLEKKDYARALSSFERADALYHAPTILIGLARSRAALGKLVGAREAYTRIVNETVAPNASSAFLKAVEEARRELSALAPRVPSLVIDVQGVDVVKVHAAIDGAAIPSAALGATRPTDPGRHTIQVAAPGFEAAKAIITVAEGRTETVTIRLKPSEGAPPVVTEPSPALGGKGTSALTPVDTSGASGTTIRPLGFVGLGVGAAGLIAGGITGALVIAKHGDISGSCPQGHCPPHLKGDVDTYNLLATLSTASFVAGSALAATGAVVLLTTPSSTPSVGTFTPTVGLGYLGLRGTF